MNPKIKKQIEPRFIEMATDISNELFPPSFGLEQDELECYINNVAFGIQYGYNIKESVNQQMLEALKRINDCSLSKQQREVMIENAILSASNESKKESVNVELKTALEYLLNYVTKDRFKCELQDAIPKAQEALLSASNQENNEVEKYCNQCGNDERFKYNDQYSNGEQWTCLDCEHTFFINPPKEK